MSSAAERFTILFVCSGNRCRSPVAELATRALIAQRFGADAARFSVSSVGTAAAPGLPMHEDTAAALAKVDIETPAFAGARQASASVLAAADLVLTADRSQRGRVVQLEPAVLGRTFTLREFARLLGPVDRESFPSDPVAMSHAAVVAARDNRGLTPPCSPADDDIADPSGQERGAHRAAVTSITAALSACFGIEPLTVGRKPRDREPQVQFPAVEHPLPALDEPAAPDAKPGAVTAVAGPRPSAIRWSFLLWLGFLVATAGAVALCVIQIDDVRAELERTIRDHRPTKSQQSVDDTTDLFLMATLGLTALFASVEILLAATMRTRRRWARTSLAVVSVIGVAPVLASTFVVSTMAAGLLWAAIGFTFFAGVVMYLPTANDWFANRRASTPEPDNTTTSEVAHAYSS